MDCPRNHAGVHGVGRGGGGSGRGPVSHQAAERGRQVLIPPSLVEGGCNVNADTWRGLRRT